jgi:hypothetical protein
LVVVASVTGGTSVVVLVEDVVTVVVGVGRLVDSTEVVGIKPPDEDEVGIAEPLVAGIDVGMTGAEVALSVEVGNKLLVKVGGRRVKVEEEVGTTSVELEVAVGVVSGTLTEIVGTMSSIKPPDDVLVEVASVEVPLAEVEVEVVVSGKRPSRNPPEELVDVGVTVPEVDVEVVDEESLPRRSSSKPPEVLVDVGVALVDERAVEVVDEVSSSPPRRSSSRPPDELVAGGDVVVVDDVESVDSDVVDEEDSSGKSKSRRPPDELVVVVESEVVVVSASVSLGFELVDSVVLELSVVSVVDEDEPPRRPPKRSSTKPPSCVDEEVLVFVADSESAVVVAVTSATVAFLVVVDAALVAAPVLALPVMVCVFPFSSTERVIGTTTTCGPGSLVVVGSGDPVLKRDSSQLKFKPSEFEFWRLLRCLFSKGTLGRSAETKSRLPSDRAAARRAFCDTMVTNTAQDAQKSVGSRVRR